ncbi:hypothetical protein BDZ85DRAFT_13770 [Elsinoe ampelina]|uniref:Uncharacterized protein n=1 Tax=Elsinoe ampelina TaxID=302913 RepID=A0A6A6GRP1_9PEZI|nr:hypothetical protein BDZ85DRAFT_13770 [Elsinoe ampelina]
MCPYLMDQALCLTTEDRSDRRERRDLRSGPTIFILGSRGTRKTQLAHSIADHVSGELVSIDSVKVYSDVPALTGRSQTRVKEHMTGYLATTDEPSCFLNDVHTVIDDIHRRRRVAILHGGSTSLTTPLLFDPRVQLCRLLVIILHGKQSDIEASISSRIDRTLPSILADVRKLHTLERQNYDSQPLSGVFKAHGYQELRPWARAAALADAQSADRGPRLPPPCTAHKSTSSRSAHKAARRRLHGLLETGVAQLKKASTDHARRQSQWLFTEVIPTLHSQNMDFRMFNVPGPDQSEDRFDITVTRPVLIHVREWLDRQRAECMRAEPDSLTHLSRPKPEREGQRFWKNGRFDWSMITPTGEHEDERRHAMEKQQGNEGPTSCGVEADMDLRDIRQHFAGYGL